MAIFQAGPLHSTKCSWLKANPGKIDTEELRTISVFPSFPSIELQSCKFYLFLKRPWCYLKTYHLRNCGFKEKPAKLQHFPKLCFVFQLPVPSFIPRNPISSESGSYGSGALPLQVHMPRHQQRQENWETHSQSHIHHSMLVNTKIYHICDEKFMVSCHFLYHFCNHRG